MDRNARRTGGFRLAALSLVLALSACGGGGGGGDEPPKPTAIPEGASITAPSVAEMASATQFGSSVASLAGLKFSWDFGDGNTSTLSSPSHSYLKGGDYEVLLKISNEAGASRELRYQLTVNNPAQTRGLVCSGEKESGWCWQRPLPTGNERRDYFFLDAAIGWMVGGNGEIFKTVDAGKTWQRQVSGVDTTLTQVRFADANRGWIVGDFGALLRTVDGGASWQLSKLDGAGYSNSFLAVDTQYVALKDSEGTIRYSSDGGLSWKKGGWSSQVLALSEDRVLWSLVDGSLHKSSDFGATTSPVLALRISGTSSYDVQVKLNGASGVFVRSSSYGYVNGVYTYQTEWWRSRDSGGSWDRPRMMGLPVDANGGNGYQLIYGGAAGYLLVLAGGIPYHSADDGDTWQKVNISSDGYVDAAAFFPLGGQRLMYSYTYGQTLLSVDGGRSWMEVAKPEPLPYGTGPTRSVRAPAANTLVLTTAEGSGYLSGDNGMSWRQIGGQSAAQRNAQLRTLWPLSASKLLGVSTAGELLLSKDGGRNWEIKQTGLAGYSQTQLQFTSAQAGWMNFGDGRIYRSVDGGETWSSGLASQLYANNFHFVDESNGWAVSRGRLVQSKDGGLSWSDVAALPSDAWGVRFQSSSRGLVWGYRGLHETLDGGRTWVPRFTGSVSSFQNVVYADADNVWAFGSGDLIQSTDGGTTWRRASIPVANVYWTSLQFLDAKRGWVASNNGLVFHTADGGKTWQRQISGTEQNILQLRFVDAKTGWMIGESGALLTTGTGGL